jgi:DNA-binding LytR/AlgR family response regulator
VDDEELARELIETHLSQLDQFELVASCESALEAQKVLRSESVDLLFLDIEMPVLKGTDFLKGLISTPKVIFTTAYRDYAIEGFELNAVDYLLKPIVFDRFFKAVEKFLAGVKPMANTALEIQEQDHIYVQSKRKNIKIRLEEILYVESIKDYVKVQLDDEEVIFKAGITAFHERLDSRFIRVHRSFLVNTSKITAFTKNDIEIAQKEIPIGEMYKAEVMASLG